MYLALTNNYSGQIINSTIASNMTAAVNNRYGGGVFLTKYGAGSTPTYGIYNSTIAGNYAYNNGGGIQQAAATLYLYSTIVAENTLAINTYKDLNAGGAATVCSNSFIGSNSGAAAEVPAGTPNVYGTYAGTSGSPLDPLLLPLADNGGDTLTCALSVTNSLAYNHGTNILSLLYDQRNIPYSRIGAGACDIGACEFGVSPGTGTLILVF